MLPFLELLETKEEKDKLHTLYQAFERQLYYLAYSMLKDEMKAEDMVQETFMTMADHLDAIEEETYAILKSYLERHADSMTLTQYAKKMEDEFCGKAWGYVATVLKRKVYSSFREEEKEEKSGHALLLLYEELCEKRAKNPADIMEKEEWVEVVKQELSSMKYPYKEALCMRYYDELSASEIGSVMGKTEENVRQILNRGRLTLRKKLEKRGIL